MVKVTFSLDEQSVSYLNRMSDRLGIPKSQVVREAIKLYGEHRAQLSDEERSHMLAAFDEVVERIPTRPREEVERELREIRAARVTGGRGSAEAHD